VRTSPQSVQSVCSGVVRFSIFRIDRQLTRRCGIHGLIPPSGHVPRTFPRFSKKRKKNFPSRLATSLRLIQSALSFFGLQFRDTKAIAWAKNKIFSVSKYTPTTSLTLQRAFFWANGKRKEKREELCRSASEKPSPRPCGLAKEISPRRFVLGETQAAARNMVKEFFSAEQAGERRRSRRPTRRFTSRFESREFEFFTRKSSSRGEFRAIIKIAVELTTRRGFSRIKTRSARRLLRFMTINARRRRDIFRQSSRETHRSAQLNSS
jgi:hypothetical protein